MFLLFCSLDFLPSFAYIVFGRMYFLHLTSREGLHSFYSQLCSSAEFADGVIAVHAAPAPFVPALTGCFSLDLTLKF